MTCLLFHPIEAYIVVATDDGVVTVWSLDGDSSGSGGSLSPLGGANTPRGSSSGGFADVYRDGNNPVCLMYGSDCAERRFGSSSEHEERSGVVVSQLLFMNEASVDMLVTVAGTTWHLQRSRFLLTRIASKWRVSRLEGLPL